MPFHTVFSPCPRFWSTAHRVPRDDLCPDREVSRSGKIIATGRNAASLESLKLAGADFTISLEQDEECLSRAFESHFSEGVDVVLDYLWGPSARSLLIAAAKASAEAYPVRFVQIGSIGGADIPLPGALFRSAAITLLGSGIGGVALPRLLHAVKEVFNASVPAGLQIATDAVPLANLSQRWGNADSRVRTVFTLRSCD
jgi:NADPH:quinone reductase-like Zn-dependent oxidoreductase